MSVRSPDRTGYSLLELLLTLAIGTILMALLGNSLRGVKDSVLAVGAKVKGRHQMLKAHIDAQMGPSGSLRDPSFQGGIVGLFDFTIWDLSDEALARYDLILINGANVYTAHAQTLEVVARYRRLRPNGWVIIQERWDLMEGKAPNGRRASRSPMPAPEEFGGWNPNWVAAPRAGWPTPAQVAQMIADAGFQLKLTEFLDRKNHRPLIGNRNNYLPYAVGINSDRTVSIQQVKCRVSAPGYLDWRIAFAMRWQQIVGADGILVGSSKYSQYWDDDLMPKEMWLSHFLMENQFGAGMVGADVNFGPSDEPFIDWAQAMFELASHPGFGYLPRLGWYNNGLIERSRNGVMVDRYRPGQRDSFWNASLSSALGACQWWSMWYEDMEREDIVQAAWLRNLAQESLDRGQMPLVTLRSAATVPASHVPNAGRLYLKDLLSQTAAN